MPGEGFKRGDPFASYAGRPGDGSGELTLENIDRARPGVKVIEVSSRTGEGMEAWYAFVRGG